MSLKKLGLSDYESRIYETLLSLGRVDARAISKESKVPPTAVYPNLRSLEKKGFVQVFDGENYLFEAVPPRIALDGFEEKKIREMRASKEEAIKELEVKKPLDKQYDPVKLSYGKESSVSLFSELSAKANKSVYIAGWKFSKAKDIQGLVNRVKEMRKRGVDVRIVFSEHSEVADYLSSELSKLGVKVKFFHIGNFSIILFDDKLCKISLKSEDRKERVNILFEDRDLAQSMAEYFNLVWKKAEN